MTNKLSILHTNDKGKIISYKARKIVKPIGSSGYVLLPKKLIGKIVEVFYGIK